MQCWGYPLTMLALLVVIPLQLRGIAQAPIQPTEPITRFLMPSNAINSSAFRTPIGTPPVTRSCFRFCGTRDSPGSSMTS